MGAGGRDPAGRDAARRGAGYGDEVPLPRDATRSEVSGSAENVLQAGHVQGGVHFHGTGAEAAAVPRQLPGDVRGFVNRSSELDRLETALSQAGHDAAAFTVIAGTAGVGKTALALRWAHRARRHFPDGQLYVNLRGYDPGAPVSAEQALDRFLPALGVPAEQIPADAEEKSALYRSLLADRRVLLVLDNAADVAQVRPLLPAGDACRTVITSRSRLAGLVARDGARRVTVEILPEAEAVALIGSITGDYRTGDDPAELAELARLCARLPLALRIAAERAAARPWMPLEELIQALRDESGLWDALSIEDGEAGDTVRSVFAWSYRALPPGGARMFRLLGLHPGPEFGVQAAAAIAGVPVDAARRHLDGIVGAHLAEQPARDRYQFHDLLRAYATDAVHHEESLAEQYAALNRVLGWYLHTASAAAAALRSPLRLPAPTALPAPDSVLGFDAHREADLWFSSEWANLLAAVAAAGRSGQDRAAWQLALTLQPVFMGRGPIADREQIAGTALEAARRDGDTDAEATARSLLADLYSSRGRRDEALRMHEEILALRRESGDAEGAFLSANDVSVVLLHLRRFDEAAGLLEENLEAARSLGSAGHEATSLFNLSAAYSGARRFNDAARTAQQSLEISRSTGDQWREMISLVYSAEAHASAGRTEAAFAAAEAGLGLARERNDQRNEGWALLALGAIQRGSGQGAEALISYQRALTLYTALGSRSREVQCLNGAGEAYQSMGRMTEAAQFHRRAATVAREVGEPWPLAVSLESFGRAAAGADAEAEAESGPDSADGTRADPRSGDVRAALREAETLLSAFGDPEARERRRRIAERLR